MLQPVVPDIDRLVRIYALSRQLLVPVHDFTHSGLLRRDILLAELLADPVDKASVH